MAPCPGPSQGPPEGRRFRVAYAMDDVFGGYFPDTLESLESLGGTRRVLAAPRRTTAGPRRPRHDRVRLPRPSGGGPLGKRQPDRRASVARLRRAPDLRGGGGRRLPRPLDEPRRSDRAGSGHPAVRRRVGRGRRASPTGRGRVRPRLLARPRRDGRPRLSLRPLETQAGGRTVDLPPLPRSARDLGRPLPPPPRHRGAGPPAPRGASGRDDRLRRSSLRLADAPFASLLRQGPSP